MSVAVIQGASGGLGLNLTRHILANTSLKVYALTHRASSDVQERILANAPSGISERLSVVGEVDVREENGLEKVAGTIKQRDGKGSVRLVACLAGILHPEKSLSAISPKDALDTFAINTLGHLLTYKHLVPLIPTKKEMSKLSEAWWEEGDPAKGLVGKDKSLCFSLSARVGSIKDNEKGGWYSYRSSKAALNQIIRTLDHELTNKSSSAIAVGYHPGTVLTEFTRPVIGDKPEDIAKGVLNVDTAILKMTEVMTQSTTSDGWGGKCWDWKGKRVEW